MKNKYILYAILSGLMISALAPLLAVPASPATTFSSSSSSFSSSASDFSESAVSMRQLIGKRFESVCQELSYYIFDLQTRLKGHENSLLPLERELFDSCNDLLKQIADASSVYFHENRPDVALRTMGNFALKLCNKSKLRHHYLFSFPEEVAQVITCTEQLDQLEHAANTWTAYSQTIQPRLSYAERAKQLLLYNFFSTRVMPKVMIGAGGAMSLAWLIHITNKFNEDMNRNEPVNPLFEYKNVEHDLGCRDVQGKCRHYDCIKKENRYGSVVRPLEIDHTGNRYCPGKDTQCTHVVGFNKNPATYIKSAAIGSRFTMPFFAMRYLAKLVEESQLPEYENRIKLRQKQEEDKRVLLAMKKLKTTKEHTVDFSAVKGHEGIIKLLAPIVDLLKHPFKYNGLSRGGLYSILFYGPPGTGKTMIARAIGKESGAPIVEISGDEILADNSKDKIMASLKLAEKLAMERPEKSAIVYVDEIDCFVGNRSQGELDPARAHALSNLLSIFDGVQRRNPYVHIVVMMTTNKKENLDPALLRPGRIDKKIFVGHPDDAARKEFFINMLPAHLHNMIAEMVTGSNGMSGAQIVNIFDEAKLMASYEGVKEPTADHYRKAIKQVQ